jgi:hypothetical protein
MPDWKGKCHRCNKESLIHIMSIFNTDLICMECKDAEKAHPRYQEAVDAEIEATMHGDFDFQGIGWDK